MAKIVAAKSVADYLQRYYKKDKMTSTLLSTYEDTYREKGYICTSHHDNILGEFIFWPTAPKWAKVEPEYTCNNPHGGECVWFDCKNCDYKKQVIFPEPIPQ
jgi:hypothetical protein